jgi:hypothetical protein
VRAPGQEQGEDQDEHGEVSDSHRVFPATEMTAVPPMPANAAPTYGPKPDNLKPCRPARDLHSPRPDVSALAPSISHPRRSGRRIGFSRKP